MSANLRTREKPGENVHSAQKAAQSLQVSTRSVESADKVKKHGIPELVEAVAAGQVAVSPASRIATLPPEKQKEVLAGIRRGLKPKQALAQLREESQQPRNVDDAGKPLPEQAIPAFQQRRQLRAVCRHMDSFIREVARLGESPVGTFIDSQGVQDHLREARQKLWTAQPAHVCPSCQGTESCCTTCRGRGWIAGAMADQTDRNEATASKTS